MKQLIIAALLFIGASLYAQPSEQLAKEKMKVFAAWAGRWKGDGMMKMGPGDPKKSSVDEKVELKLEGSLLVVEGVGKAIDPNTKQEMVVHHAYGIVSYDQMKNEYKFKTYLKDGRSTDAWFNVVSDNKYQWGFDLPTGKTRYSIDIDPINKTWVETGEFSQDGNNWYKFFSMNLTKAD